MGGVDRRQVSIGLGAALLYGASARAGQRRSGANLEVSARIVDGLIAIPLSLPRSGPLWFEISTVAEGLHLRASLLPRRAAAADDRVPLALHGTVLSQQRPVLHGVDWALPAPLAGLVGLDVFAGLSVELNFRAVRVRVGPAALPPPNGRTIFGYAAASRPSVPVSVGDVTFPAVIDTGQIRAPLLVSGALAERIGRGARTDAGEARIGGAPVRLTAIALAAPVRVGETRLAASGAIFPGPSALSNLGALALRGAILRIDPVNRRVHLLGPR